MKKLILLSYLLFATLCSAQIDFVKQADLLLNANRNNEIQQFEKALQFYEEAFSINANNINTANYLKAALCAAELKKKDQCEKWIMQSITKSKASKEFLEEFSVNNFYQKILASILPKYNTYLTQFYKEIDNPQVYFDIQKLLNRDQFSRRLKDYYLGISEEEQEDAFDGFAKAQASKDTVALKKYKAILFPKLDKVYKDYNSKLGIYTDSLNVVKLIDITKNYGWKKEGWMILWHQRGTYGKKNWVWNYFKPLIDKEIAEGKVSPFFWAAFEDITSIRKTGKSIYGYHPGKVDPETVNMNRRKIGLPELTQQEIENRNNRKDHGRVF